MIKLYDILLELGDSQPIKYKKTYESNRYYQYTFKIKGVEYEVELRSIDNNAIDISFSAFSKDDHFAGSDSINKGHQFKVIATITQIVIDFLQNHKEINVIQYEPAKRDFKDYEYNKKSKQADRNFGDKEDTGRESLYAIFAKKAIQKLKELGETWNYTKKPNGFIEIIKQKSK